jgi:hypothetical protein
VKDLATQAVSVTPSLSCDVGPVQSSGEALQSSPRSCGSRPAEPRSEVDWEGQAASRRARVLPRHAVAVRFVARWASGIERASGRAATEAKRTPRCPAPEGRRPNRVR